MDRRKPNNIRAVTVLAAWLLLAFPVLADTFTGFVVKVADGDTLTVLDADRTQHKIRLSGIDAPESGQHTAWYLSIISVILSSASQSPSNTTSGTTMAGLLARCWLAGRMRT